MAEELQPYIIFSDGTFAVFKRIVQDVSVKENGITTLYNEFYLRPTLKLRKKHNITEKDDDFINTGEWAGYYKKKYAKDYCKPLDLSPDSSTWLLFCDYEGNAIDLFGGMMQLWLDKIKSYSTQIEALKTTNALLRLRTRKISTNTMGDIKKSSKELKGLLDDMSIPVIAGGEEESGGRQE